MKRTPRDEFLRTVAEAASEAFDKIEEHTAKISASLREQALDSIKSALAPEPPPRIAARAPVKQLAAPKAAKTGGGRGSGVMHCSKCGAEGFNARGCGLTHDANGAIRPPEELEDEEPSTRARELAASKTRKGTKGTSNVSSSARAILERTRRGRDDEDDAEDAEDATA